MAKKSKAKRKLKKTRKKARKAFAEMRAMLDELESRALKRA